MNGHLKNDDLIALSICPDSHGDRVLPDIFGDYVLCEGCTVLPRDPFT